MNTRYALVIIGTALAFSTPARSQDITPPEARAIAKESAADRLTSSSSCTPLPTIECAARARQPEED